MGSAVIVSSKLWIVLVHFLVFQQSVITASVVFYKEDGLHSKLPFTQTNAASSKKTQEETREVNGKGDTYFRHDPHIDSDDNHLARRSRDTSGDISGVAGSNRNRNQVAVPAFEYPEYQTVCKEDVELNTNLINATLVHLPTASARVDISIDNGNFSARWDGTNVTISSKLRLDADDNGGSYHFTVMATVVSTGQKATALIRILTQNTNDEPPRFTQDKYTATVDETAGPNTLVATVIATDKDGDRITYAFPGDATPFNMFKIDSKTGVIRLHGPGPTFDFRQDSYALIVAATDDGSCCPNSVRPAHTTKVQVIVIIIDVNDHKPVFEDCDKYQAAIEENKPINSIVIQVKATDADRGSNGQVRYSIVLQSTEVAKFKIDSINGEIFTSKIFDREGKDGKLVSVTVKATDLGVPPLEGLCSLQVHILDVNDNAPQFDRENYKEVISVNKNMGDYLFTVSASDADAGLNATIIYSLGSDTSTDAQFFSIHPELGRVTLKKQLTKTAFKFEAIATDKGVPPKSTRVSVEIEIAKGNYKPPSWIGDYSKPIEVKEDVVPNTVIATIKAVSGVPKSKKVIYSLLTGKTPETNQLSTFVHNPETESDTTIVKIVVNTALDYEAIKNYQLTIRAENAEMALLAVETTLQIQIVDVNDERPLFTSPESISVLEEQPPGTSVDFITAMDRDETLAFRTVVYSMVQGEGDDKFDINSKTGELKTKIKFDRESQSLYNVRIAAQDSAPSSYPNQGGKPNSHTSTFRIRIDDINDNPPMFQHSRYEAEVQENEDFGHPVITVTASDIDSTSKSQYQLTDGNVGGAFSVDSETGIIRVAGSIDFETNPSFDLTLVASDGLYTNKTLVHIKVLDINDLPPVFEKITYEVALMEEDDKNLPRPILTVKAIDPDKHRPQQIIIYTLSGQGTNPPDPAFKIGRTNGVIDVHKALDRDKPNGRPQWRFTVLAEDEGGRNGSLMGYAEVKVNLIDINDNRPMFMESKYEGLVEENKAEGELALTMTAVDYDDPLVNGNAVLKYYIIKNALNTTVNRAVFKINPHNAEIRTNLCCLDRESVAQYIIVIKVEDGDGKSDTGTATINVKDVNDCPPRFEFKTYQREIDESFGMTISTDPVLVVKVLDDDLPETNKNYFTIEGDSPATCSKMFRIARSSVNSDEGELTACTAIDYENEQHKKGFNFTIRVDDTGGVLNDPGHTDSAFVFITVHDINDNPPEFINPFENVSVAENAKEGTVLAKFSAVDKDNDGKSLVSYRLARETNQRRHFQITTDGVVKIHRPLDREHTALHTVRVLAVDDGRPPLTGTATLLVNVLDINDNPPAFCEDYVGYVKENGADTETPVKNKRGQTLVMEACDPDEPKNGPPFTFSMDATASNDIKKKFDLRFQSQGGSKNQGSATLYVRGKLDREEQKDYRIPVRISDSGTPRLTGTSTLTVIVGDDNDHNMKDGSTTIEVFLFKGRSHKGIIGQVYADDEDDYDVDDKTFSWDGSSHSQFDLNEASGEITMLEKTREGTYTLHFTVADSRHGSTARATVTVKVFNIPEEAVYKSGSIRIKDLSEEDFISIWDYKNKAFVTSKREKLKTKIAEVLGVSSLENVQIFTVMKSEMRGMLDVRFAVHGSPYYEPERVNGVLNQHLAKIESDVGIQIEMIGIDDCMYETLKCDASCYNNMTIRPDKPYMITAKLTGLAGIHAVTSAACTCYARDQFPKQSCDPNPCFHDGKCRMEQNSARCSCPIGYDGPRCQETSRSFNGDGYAWFAPLKLCADSHLSLEFLTKTPDGLLFYNGPITEPNPKTQLVKDFISLELLGGRPKLLIDLGSGTIVLHVNLSPNLADGKWHRLDVFWNPEGARLMVDLCQAIANKGQDGETPKYDRTLCEKSGIPPGYHGYLNVNGPLQLGGVKHPQLLDYKWVYRHGRTYFNGCIRNFVHNSEVYNLASAEMLSVNSKAGCSSTEDICQANELSGQCQYGSCSSSLISTSRSCLCRSGYHGDTCEKETAPATFYNNSYVRYYLKADLNTSEHQFRSEIQLTYRARWDNASIFSVAGKGKEFMRLEIVNSRLRFTFNLKDTYREEQQVSLPQFIANDGDWHTVSIIRYGSYAALAIDGGEGKQYEETLIEDLGYNQLLRINKNQVVLRTHPEFATHPAAPLKYAKACLEDFRFDRHSYHLPMPPLEKDTLYGSVIDSKVELGCNSSACIGVNCPPLTECVDLFLVHECRCLPGYRMIGKDKCVDIDECEELFPGPCLNGGVCTNLVPLFHCICPDGYTGTLCDVIQQQIEIQLSMGGLVAIVACVLIVLILVILLMIYTCKRKQRYGPVAPEEEEEDIKDDIKDYNDEGFGESDTRAFDPRLLRIPLDDPIKISHTNVGFSHPEKEPLQQGPDFPDMDYTDVGGFITDNLDKANEDDDDFPLDDVRLYSYEGGGSSVGSLSSLGSGTDEEDQDFEYLNDWGVQFRKLADIYGEGESDED